MRTVFRAIAKSRHGGGEDHGFAQYGKAVYPPASDLVDTLRRQLLLAEDVPVIVSVGRLSLEKGHADLLEALAFLRQRQPGLRFHVVIVGDGPERETLKKRVAALRLEGLVRLCGHHADVVPFYALASMAVLASHSEGSPNALLEAMSAGLATVATAVGGVTEIATHDETALLVQRRDYEAMAQSLERLLCDVELRRRLGRQAQAHVLAQFTPEIYRRKLTEIYQLVLREAV